MSESSDLKAAQADYAAQLAQLRLEALAAKAAEQSRWRDALTDRDLAFTVLLACLLEALENWKDAANYKGEFLAEKHGDHERIAEIAKLLEDLGGGK